VLSQAEREELGHHLSAWLFSQFLDALMRSDEEIAERIDAEKYAAGLAARQAEAGEAVAEGAG
jgi:hypothetical protein